MSTASSSIREYVIDALRAEGVAFQAGVDFDTWASAIIPRVFNGYAGFLGARNRGRCPFFEVMVSAQTFTDETGQGGTLKTIVKLKLHDTGRDIEATTDRMDATMAAGIASIRDNRTTLYTQIGDSEIADVQPGPMGWMLEATLNLEHSYDRESHEVVEE